MKTILIIDDNPEQSETVKTNIELELEKLDTSFQVTAIFPFDELANYIDYIDRNEVCALIVDEKLNNQPNDKGRAVNYLGHKLTSYLREREKDIPIYTVTSYDEDADLQSLFSEYEQIIKRKDFYNHPEKYVPIILRAASSFVDRYSNLLAEFTSIAQDVASGKETTEKLERMRAIQTAIELPVSGFEERSTWLDEYDAQIRELESLRDKLISKNG